jgi:hypothetical protein
MTGPIAREQFGTLIVHELNMVHQMPCCSTCCAPCGVLKDLADSGMIHYYVRAAPAHLLVGSAWWVNDAVNLPWLYSRLNGEGAGCHSSVSTARTTTTPSATE